MVQAEQIRCGSLKMSKLCKIVQQHSPVKVYLKYLNIFMQVLSIQKSN